MPQQQQSPTVNRNSTITRPTTQIQLKLTFTGPTRVTKTTFQLFQDHFSTKSNIMAHINSNWTPPAHNRQSTIPRSSAPNCSRNSTMSRPLPTFSRPPPRNNYRFHQQTYIPRPHNPEFNYQRPPLLPRPSYQHQDFIPRPYQQHQQTQGHYTQQVSLPPYVPIIIRTPYNQINNVLAQQTTLFNPNQQ